MSTIDDLRTRGLIEAVEPDQATATGWLDDAGRHVEAATRIAELDPSGAYVLAYDAARKSVAGALLMAGYRVPNRPGSHQTLRNTPTRWRRKPAKLHWVASIASGATETNPSTDPEPLGWPRSKRPSKQPKPFARPARG